MPCNGKYLQFSQRALGVEAEARPGALWEARPLFMSCTCTSHGLCSARRSYSRNWKAFKPLSVGLRRRPISYEFVNVSMGTTDRLIFQCRWFCPHAVCSFQAKPSHPGHLASCASSRVKKDMNSMARFAGSSLPDQFWEAQAQVLEGVHSSNRTGHSQVLLVPYRTGTD